MSMGLQSNDKESSPRAESPTEAGVWMRSPLAVIFQKPIE